MNIKKPNLSWNVSKQKVEKKICHHPKSCYKLLNLNLLPDWMHICCILYIYLSKKKWSMQSRQSSIYVLNTTQIYDQIKKVLYLTFFLCVHNTKPKDTSKTFDIQISSKILRTMKTFSMDILCTRFVKSFIVFSARLKSIKSSTKGNCIDIFWVFIFIWISEWSQNITKLNLLASKYIWDLKLSTSYSLKMIYF